MTRALVALFAHPDDETFATGATLARYAAEGVRCTVYSATDGDAGKTAGIVVASKAELAAIRRDELRAACCVLGCTEPVFGGHADGALAAADPELVLGQMVAVLRRERPDVVLTFGPEGAPTRHRDHRAVSRLAMQAVLLAGTEGEFPDAGAPWRAPRLCVVTWQPGIHGERYTALGQPVEICVDATPWLETKRRAFAEHRTQQMSAAAFEAAAFTPTEDFFVAGGEKASRGVSDLFAGL